MHSDRNQKTKAGQSWRSEKELRLPAKRLTVLLKSSVEDSDRICHRSLHSIQSLVNKTGSQGGQKSTVTGTENKELELRSTRVEESKR
jgi:hypothetical protein